MVLAPPDYPPINAAISQKAELLSYNACTDWSIVHGGLERARVPTCSFTDCTEQVGSSAAGLLRTAEYTVPFPFLLNKKSDVYRILICLNLINLRYFFTLAKILQGLAMTKGTPEDIEYAEQARIAAAAEIERITVSIINLICSSMLHGFSKVLMY